MNTAGINVQRWLIIAIVGGVVAAGIWAFTADKPPRVSQVQIAIRNVDEQRAELGLRETDHEGREHFYEADGPDLDLSLNNRPRSLYSDPIVLSNDKHNAPSKVRITMRSLSDSEVKLGLRSIRPSGAWDSTRFPRDEPITMSELRSQEWFYLSSLPVRVLYHQPLVDGVRLLLYIAGAFGVLFALIWIVWRRWLS